MVSLQSRGCVSAPQGLRNDPPPCLGLSERGRKGRNGGLRIWAAVLGVMQASLAGRSAPLLGWVSPPLLGKDERRDGGR